MTAETPRPASAAARMRASDADREAVVEQLREAAAEGRIDLDELDTRLGQALAAKTYADLAPLTEDLVPIEVAAGEPLVLKGGMHGVKRAGAWKVPAVIVAQGGMGGVRIDFTRAECRLREIALEVRGEMGGVRIVVPEGWDVDADRVSQGLGALKDRTTHERTPGAPVLRLTGSSGMGGVYVRHPNFVERRKLRDLES
ncbi:DUF1707 domain-containing protein [Streptomyces sp. NPDC052095]|uniref:DUF1707 SHOCT-like domain-containing protein n=1 Tax=unclassified Streptomyces TaxID=2593676 RepID=UPI00344EBF49